MNIVRERTVPKIYHYSKRIWSGTYVLGVQEKDFRDILDLMLWFQYAYAKYNNYQRVLEFREPSFARWRDERGVSADTKPLPLLRQ